MIKVSEIYFFYSMRFFTLLLALASTQLAHAQLFTATAVGSYVLRASPQVRQQGGLYLRSSDQLVVSDLAGKKTSFSPQQVSSFQIDKQRFVATAGFQLPSSFHNAYVTSAFAELLDSGQVVLLRYQTPPNTAATRGNIGYDNAAGQQVYLLRFASTPDLTPIPASWSKKSTRYQAAIRPYLASRPDLIQLLEANRLAPKQLPFIIYLLNNNLPYSTASERAAAK